MECVTICIMDALTWKNAPISDNIAAMDANRYLPM